MAGKSIKEIILETIWTNAKAVDVVDGIMYIMDWDGAVYDMTCPELYLKPEEVDHDMFIANSKIGR